MDNAIYEAAAAILKVGGIVAVIDSGKRFDAIAAKTAGCELDFILVSQPDSENAAAEIC